MYNPLTFIKDVIDILKDGGPGEARTACEIVPANRNIIMELDPRAAKYANIGDFVVEFETHVTIVPAKDFYKHYAFTRPPTGDELDMTPVTTIKPI